MKIIIKIVAVLLVLLFFINYFVRVSQGTEEPSRGIIMEWILR